MEEDTLNSESYVTAKVMVKGINDVTDLNKCVPMCDVEVHHANPITVGMLCFSLEKMAEAIKKEHEYAEEAYELLKLTDGGSKTIKVRGEEKDD